MEIKFEPLGIADVLTRYHLKVPLNQREYSWETAEGSSHPGWVPVETADVNLEHIMPQTLSPNWPNVTEHIIETHANRLGNLALLEASVNVDIDKEKWAVKKAALSKSVYTFTRHVKDASSWGIKEIDERQKTMAKHAVKAWPIG